MRRNLFRAAVGAVLLAVFFAGLPHPAPVGAAPLTNGGFTTSAAVSATNVGPGDPVTFTVRVTSDTDRTVMVYAEVNDPTAVRKAQFFFDDESFAAGVEQSFPIPWTVPVSAATGGYSLAVRVFTPHQGSPLHLNDSAAFFTVGMPNPPVGGPVRIMPLGDDLTDGFTINGGYRIDLFTLLASAPHTVDFVGSRFNGVPGLADKQHEGHVGWKIADLTGGVIPWVRAYRPQIVLLLVGTNDMIQNDDPGGAPARLGTLIDLLKVELPESAIVVSSLPRNANGDVQARIQTFNAQIPGLVASKGSKVSFVDGYAAIDPVHLDANGTHLTLDGYGRLAQVWYAAVHAIINAQFPPTSTPTPTPTSTATPTLTPTITPGPCSPRPPVRVSVTKTGAIQLTAVVTVTGQGNTLREVQVGDARNATVSGAGRSGSAFFTIPLVGGPTSVTLTVSRNEAGKAVHVPLVVVDQCGEWNTFVGGGTAAF
jgi:hypothetical protein